MENLPFLAAGGGALVLALVVALAISWRSSRAASAALVACQGEKAAFEAAKTELEKRFGVVLDAEQEAMRIRSTVESERAQTAKEIAKERSEAETLRQKYATAFQRYQQLEVEVTSLEENLESIAVGLYRPHFTYSDSDAYKVAVSELREKQKDMIRYGRATQCNTEWTVGGSKREGARMVKQYERLILRAFNAESDAAIANVSWNNFRVMQTRIEKAAEALNRLGTVMHVTLLAEYVNARLEELQLVFEAAEKKQQEREEQRRLRAEQREEERVQRELEREREDAERDEVKYQKALDKMRAELAKSLDAEREVMSARVSELEADLAAAHERKERAISQAQLTRVGHVYIISNLGAFGEGVIKIGLTRRLDPRERVRELGDASVPFPFDLHALIYSEDAPSLETKLHEYFWEKRLNWANDRKEFFRATVEEVDAVLKELGLQANLLSLAEAREYRETLAALEKSRTAALLSEGGKSIVTSRLPADPFAEELTTLRDQAVTSAN